MVIHGSSYYGSRIHVKRCHSGQIIKLFCETHENVVKSGSEFKKPRWLIGFYPGIYCMRTFNSSGLYPACFIPGWYNLQTVFSGSQILDECFSICIR
ncbi:hypothetical protein ES703_109148 [subsurface metagenome]